MSSNGVRIVFLPFGIYKTILKKFAPKTRKTPMKSEFFAGHLFCYPFMVEVTGLEPAASASRTQRSTKLSHTSYYKIHSIIIIYLFCLNVNIFLENIFIYSILCETAHKAFQKALSALPLKKYQARQQVRQRVILQHVLNIFYQ